MNDRELLEMAAKAAGIVVTRSRLDDPMSRDMLIEDSARNPHQKAGPWNPLTDDGDALRLAVKCYITDLSIALGRLVANEGDTTKDVYAGVRRAIVFAAAEIGRGIVSASKPPRSENAP